MLCIFIALCHCITNFVLFFLVVSLLFFLCCCFVVFGRVRLQNHFFYHSSLEGGGPFLYHLFTSVFTNCQDYSDIHVVVVCC